MQNVILNSKNAKQLGRTLISGENLKLILSGTGCEFMFTGRKLEISLGIGEDCLNDGNVRNFPRVAILVNDKFIVKKVIAARRERFIVFKSEEPTSVNVKIIKLSEAAFSIAEVYPVEIQDSDIITPIPGKSLKMEFIGDSITCGYGTDDSNIDSEFSTCAENVMKSYAYLAAQMLDADYSIFSASGYGIISGFSDDGVRNTAERIPPFYNSFGFSYFNADSDKKPHELLWDFSRFVPDAIIINLGTNDNSFCRNSDTLQQEFEDAYLQFLHTVRAHNPNAIIFCVLDVIETLLFPRVQNACDRFTYETDDKKIFTLKLESQDGRLGYASKWHPSEDMHRLTAERLADFMRSILK